MTSDSKSPAGSYHSIPRSIWSLGIVGMTLNTSAVMAYTLVPILLEEVLHADPQQIGIIEGAGVAMALIMRIFAGTISDIFHTRKKIMLIGYAIAATIKPVIAISPSAAWVFFSNIIERISNAIQATPRDALISDLAPKEIKGACYGLRQMFGRIGSCIGPFLLIGVMFLMGTEDPENTRFLLWISAIPSVIALFILIFFVKDSPKILEIRKQSKQSKQKRLKLRFNDIKQFNAAYWKIVFIASIFMFARINEAFLIIRSNHLGLSLNLRPTVMIIMNFSCALAAYPLSHLSDRMGRRIPLAISFMMLVIADIFLAYSANLTLLFIGVFFWGLQLGATESLLPTLVADTAPPPLRGSAFGLYYFIIGIVQLITNWIAGSLWKTMGVTPPYLLSALSAILATILLLTIIRKKDSMHHE